MTHAAPDTPELGVPDTSKWWIPALLGVLSIIAGFLALIWPGATLLIIGITFGWLLLFVGIGDLVAAFSPGASTGRRVASGILGVLTLLAGIMLLFRPGASVLTAAWERGFWFMLTGVMQLVQGVTHHESRMWNLVFGVIGIVAGAVILGSPQIGLQTLVLIAGISFVMRGMVALTLAFTLRSLGKHGGGPSTTGKAVTA